MSPDILFTFVLSQQTMASITAVCGVIMIMMMTLTQASAACDKVSGPSGSVDCIGAQDYDLDQWGVCLTDSYIRQKSKGIFVYYCFRVVLIAVVV